MATDKSPAGGPPLIVTVSTIQPTGDSPICTVVTRSKATEGRFKSGVFEAKRSLDEFAGLLEDLIAAHPDVIPPGSAAAWLVDDEALLRHDLTRLLNRMANIEQIRQDAFFAAFLQGEDRPGEKRKKSSIQIGGLSVPLAGKNPLTSLIPQKNVPESDLYYEEQRTTVAKLDGSYRDATRAVDRLRKAHSSYLTAVRDVAAKLQNLSDCEAAGDIRGGSAQAGPRSVADAVQDAGGDREAADIRGRDQNTVEYGNYALWLHTQSATLANCKLALANRIAASEKYDAACKNTRKKREIADKAKADKAAKSQAELAEAEKTEADLKDAFFHISDSLKAEFARVEADRTADARAAITHVTNAQVKLATDIGTILEAHSKA